MKCHWCGKEYVKSIYYDNGLKKVMRNHYECPDNHGEIHLDDNGNIDTYVFYFFNNDEGSIRYKIAKHNNSQVILYIRNLGRTRGYKQVLEIPAGPSMEVKDDVPQVERMYERLKKLAIFA